MLTKTLQGARLISTTVALIAECLHLTWQIFHGGVVSHHILQRADLPAISNWWGLLLLPMLTWFLVGRMAKNLPENELDKALKAKATRQILLGFFVAFSLGVTLSFCFAQGYTEATACVFQGVLLLSVIFPSYRAAPMLGFILSMSLTFGAFIPLMIATIIAALSACLHKLFYPTLKKIWVYFRHI